MIYQAEVFVTLKPVVNDPEGLTIQRGLHSLGFDAVTEVRSGKYIRLKINAIDAEQARDRVDQMAGQLLANAVIEEYKIAIEAIAEPVGGGDRRA